ncbi:SprT-like domain-containing protein [Thioalkalicoccus limnaeus]|uniref:SprT-like domain-containing protein n=1 Tax=Thioalkalicoccus limnaeus TaxID=120681 RepID=A0ABV4BAH3_9GAMM
MTTTDPSAHDERLRHLVALATGETRRLIGVGLAARPASAGERWWGRAADAWSSEPPAIRFDLLGQSAGQFRVDSQGRSTIRYNPILLRRYGEAFVHRTVPHETAHYLAYRVHGRRIRPHGPEWQALMRALGAEPTRCHDYDVSDLRARRMRYHHYHCACRDHRLSSIRRNKVLNGARYLCRYCGEALRPGPHPAPEAAAP